MKLIRTNREELYTLAEKLSLKKQTEYGRKHFRRSRQKWFLIVCYMDESKSKSSARYIGIDNCLLNYDLNCLYRLFLSYVLSCYN